MTHSWGLDQTQRLQEQVARAHHVCTIHSFQGWESSGSDDSEDVGVRAQLEEPRVTAVELLIHHDATRGQEAESHDQKLVTTKLITTLTSCRFECRPPIHTAFCTRRAGTHA